jgi:hypothetical protein
MTNLRSRIQDLRIKDWIAAQRDGADNPARWRRFAKTLLATFAGGLAICYAFILVVDPYQVVPFSPPMPRPNIDTSQRHFYPAIIRHGNFDSYIVGNSTIRLFDPDIFDAHLGGRFANLGMNAATAWEQMQMAGLFLRVRGAPKTMIVGLDQAWCDQRADQPDRILTIRSFPDWMFDDNPWNDFLYLLNGKTLETATRVVMTDLGYGRIRLGTNGFSVYTPPDDSYDLAAAQHRIWGDREHKVVPVVPPVVLSAAERTALQFPAHPWLDSQLAANGPATRTIFVWVPQSIAVLPAPGSRDAAVEEACKLRIDAIARRYGVTVVDWRIASKLAADDSTFWDPYHHRLPIAQRIQNDLFKALAGENEAADGAWIVREHGR